MLYITWLSDLWIFKNIFNKIFLVMLSFGFVAVHFSCRTDKSITPYKIKPQNAEIIGVVQAGLAPDGGVMGHETGDKSVEDPGGGIILSTDGGTTWQRAGTSLISNKVIIDIAVDPANADVVYAATATGLYKSINGAQEFTLLAGYPATAYVRTVAVNPNNAQHLLIGLESLGIYKSTDGGQTWEIGYAGLEANNSLHDIVFDPVNADIAYTSDFKSGMYRSEDGGKTWMKINNGLRTRASLGFCISADGNHLYVATDGEGIFRLDVEGDIPVGIEQNQIRPRDFVLNQNYPNPFNPTTVISYQLPVFSQTQIDIYNITGQHIKQLFTGYQNPGYHEVPWDGTDQYGNPVSSGIYIYRLGTENRVSMIKMMLIR